MNTVHSRKLGVSRSFEAKIGRVKIASLEGLDILIEITPVPKSNFEISEPHMAVKEGATYPKEKTAR